MKSCPFARTASIFERDVGKSEVVPANQVASRNNSRNGFLHSGELPRQMLYRIARWLAEDFVRSVELAPKYEQERISGTLIADLPRRL